MSDVNELVDKLLQELRRGSITICVLSQLATRHYGYSLVTMLGGDMGINCFYHFCGY